MSSITAEECAVALLHHWISRFGVPESIVTDRGRQFTSGLWTELGNLLGVSRSRTTSYHPQSNGIIERQHRILKERIMSRSSSSGSGTWLQHLPFVLLGMRSSIRVDSQCSPSDLVFGAPLRLPGDMLSSSDPVPLASDFAARLRSVMNAAVPMPVSYHGTQPFRLDPALQSSAHVFLRVDAVRRPLVPPYVGPFKVLRRGPKTFDILQQGKTATVTIDRLKPAFTLPGPADVDVRVPVPLPAAPVGDVPVSGAAVEDAVVGPLPDAVPVTPCLDPDAWPLPTRYGRRPRPPARLNL